MKRHLFKRKRVSITLISLVFFVPTVAIFITQPALAAGNAGAAQPGGGSCYDPSKGYSTYSDTCYGGISWRFYTVKGSHYNSTSDSYTISAGNAGSATISGCNGTDGYWLLAYEKYNTKNSSPYVSSYIGAQRGAVKLSLSAHWSSGYARDASITTSGFPSLGGTIFSGTAADFKNTTKVDGMIGAWEAVENLFNTAKAEAQNNNDPALTALKKYSWNSSSSLSWFCYKGDWVDTPSSYKTVSNSGSGASYNSTGIVSSTKEATTSVATSVNTEIEVRFSHNIYSNKSTNSVKWSLERPTFSSGVTVKKQNLNMSPSPVNLTDYESKNKLYAASGRTATDGTYYYIARDVYTVSFSKEGTYTLCEKITISGQSFSTKACVKVTVGNSGSTDSQCQVPSGYPSGTIYSGETSTWTGIQSNVYPNILSNDKTIYAKPGDQVSWLHCYYPDAQGVKKSTGSHEEPTPSTGNRNNSPPLEINNTVGDQDTFVSTDNKFTINTTNTSHLQSLPTLSISNTSKFTPSSGTGSSVTFTGTRGNQSWTSATSTYRTILTNAVAKTITQSIDTQVGTNSVSGHNTWAWTYSYIQDHSGVSCDHCGETCTTSTGKDGKKSKSCSCNSCSWTTTESATGHGTHNQNWYEITGNTSSGGTSASVKIPYNYQNSITVDISDNIETVMAGEKFEIGKATTTVGTRYNSVTDGDYATKTPTATIKLYAFYSKSYTGGGGEVRTSSSHGDCGYYNQWYDQCTEIDWASSTLNNSYNMGGDTDDFFTTNNTYSVFDIPAGYQFCIGASVWPYTTDGDTDMSSPGNAKTYYATPSCRTVAKKPIFQVWGGSIFLNGKTNLSMMSKTNLYGYYGYRGKNTGIVRYYGSWGELGVMAADGVDIGNLASGAAAGYTNNNNGTLVSNPGGSKYNIDSLNHLTIPNTADGTAPAQAANSTIKANIISNYITNIDSADIHIGASTLSDGATQVYASAKDIYIDGNLVYEKTYYVSASQIPQYIVYAKNINISCDVTEIDAILIADDEVETCYDAASNDDARRSTQLTVKGSLIANSLTLGRTYGASVGKYSEIPAEIIDADPTTYLWGMSEATETPTLTTTYLHELSPRY